MVQQEYIKSPINYSGNKYKLLPQIIKLFPDKINRFIDACGGSFTVGVNVLAKEYVYNEIDNKIFNLVKYLCNSNYELENNKMQKIIDTYKLGKNTKEEYNKLREDYNNNPSDMLLFLLSCFSFNSQIRFNKKGKFNMPCGNRGYSKNMESNGYKFNKVAKNKNIIFLNNDFKDLNIKENDFVYLDPPYLQTIATYTENDGWNEEKEIDMYKWLDNLTKRNIKWALSNTIKYRGEDNNILLEWGTKYNIHKLNFTYKNNNRWGKDNTLETIEVLITNY